MKININLNAIINLYNVYREMGNGASGGEGVVSAHQQQIDSGTRVGSLAGSRQGTARGPASLAGSGHAQRYAHKSLVVGGGGSRRPSDASSAMFRQSLKSTSLAPPLLRKMRSAALGHSHLLYII